MTKIQFYNTAELSNELEDTDYNMHKQYGKSTE